MQISGEWDSLKIFLEIRSGPSDCTHLYTFAHNRNFSANEFLGYEMACIAAIRRCMQERRGRGFLFEKIGSC